MLSDAHSAQAWALHAGIVGERQQSSAAPLHMHGACRAHVQVYPALLLPAQPKWALSQRTISASWRREPLNCGTPFEDQHPLHAQPDWWALAQRHAHKLSLLAADEAENEAGGNAAHFQSPALEAAPLGEWSSPFVEGPKRPPPRYEHAVAAIGPNLYVVGGNCGTVIADTPLPFDCAAHHPAVISAFCAGPSLSGHALFC